MSPEPPPSRRHRRLIKPGFQWRVIFLFLATGCAAVLLQATLFNLLLGQAASELPNDSELLLSRIPRLVLLGTLFTSGFFLPLCAVVGVLVTFRIAGPIYRFEQHLGSLLRGEDPGPLRIRKGDEFQNLCKLLGAYLARRSGCRAEAPSPGDEQRDAA